ncbi:MAG: hypothetical protein HY606_09965, partial [Planctomycetes bacterium]|nr:hypothetical protein [Planctomycetota bacterium]
MSNTIQYHVDEKGNLRSGLYLKGARIIKPGYTIILTIKTESDNVVLKAKTQRDGFAYFQFNILDFIIAAREPFQIRCYTIINRKQISSPWSEVYRMPDWTPSTMGNKNKISLYGTWKSKRWPFKMREERLIAPDYNDQKWTEATIPGALHLRPEFDIPDPQKKDEIKLTHINQDDGFIVRKKFIVPASFRGKTILLKTEGIYPGGKIFLNNRKIGEVWTGLSPIEIDISSSCLIGQENTLAIRIYRRHPFVHLDMPRWVMDYCGIHRPITIEAFPRCRIRDLYLNPTLNDSYTAGILNGKIAITNGEDRAAIITAGIKIFDGNRQHLVKTHNLINQKIASGEPYTANFNLIVGNVKSWSCEKPNLYYAEITLKENGRLTEVVTQRIGFRRFEMRNERPLLNGVPIKIRGINRLEFHPETGLAQDEEWLRKEIFMLKRANINGVRTHLNSCHRFIELCDELGLYVIQELPLDWCPEEITDINVLGVLLHRIQASIIRDRNNPSVIVWGVGNENLVHSDSEDEKTAFWTHERLFHHWCKRLDPARPTMFPPAGPLSDFWSYVQAQIGEIGDVHYTLAPIKELQKTGKAVIYTNWKDKYTVSKEELIKNGWSGVWFSSEYFCFG